MKTITKAVAAKVVKTVSAGLCSGVGKPEPGQMCVEAAVCYALGLPHGDNPQCVSPAIRSLKIALNDSPWSSNKARADGLMRLSVLQLGTDKDFDEEEFVRRVVDIAIGNVVPRVMRYAASIHDAPKHKEALEQAAVRCEKERNEGAARAAWAAGDKELKTFATEIENILIDMKVPGVEWLDLTDKV